MAICSSVQNIAASECIGDSLVKINNNFANLNEDACTLLTLLNQLSASVPPVGSVVNTHYVDFFEPQTRSGNEIPIPFSSPTILTGHEIITKTVALTNSNNYFILQPSICAVSNGYGQMLVMLFANSTFIAQRTVEGGFNQNPTSFLIKHSPNNTNNITYSVRAAVREGYGPLIINQSSTYSGRYPVWFPTGKDFCSLLIQEIKG